MAVSPVYSIHRYTDEIYKVVAFKGHRDPDFACVREEAQHYEVKLDNSFSRARSMVLQYALCNPWDYFFTGTLDERLADRYNLDRYAKRLMQFIRDKRKKYNASFQVLLVPENHKDGAWHIHGLVYGLPASALRPFRYPEPKKLIDGGFLNWPDYQRAFGFCSLAPIRDKVARHIEQNTPFTGNVAYSQREFSYDNNLMELVRHTIEFIKGKPYGNNLLIRVKDEVKLVIEATPRYEQYDRQKIVEANKKNAVRHAYFREYLALQRLCLLILQHQKHQIGSGSRQIYGILFDGAWLWEEYVSSLIDDVFFHPMNKGGTGAQRLFDGNVGLIYPDFISRDNETRIIADAKYKPIDNIGNKDYLQVLAYMFRFDAKAGYYLYPEAAGTADRRLWMNKGSTYEANVAPRDDICLTKHGLKIPVDAENYEMFVFQMKVSEAEFRQVFAAR